MDRHRQIAFISAFILALVIMMVGKACTDSAMKKHEKPAQTGTQQSVPAQNFSYNNYNNYADDYNAPQTTSAQTAPPVNYVTNMLGEIVATEQAETVPEIQVTTEERSILEQYNAEKQQNNGNIPANNGNQTPAGVHITIH